MRPRDALWLALGALVYPITQEATMRLLGRSTLDPTHHRKGAPS